jgi:hypothetical protein
MGAPGGDEDVAATAAERVDAGLAEKARARIREGGTPTSRQVAALKRVEKLEEERLRWIHYRTIPKKHWREMSGRPAKVLLDQAKRYGLPFDGRVVDLPALARALHDFLAKNARVLSVAGGRSPEASPLEAAEIRRKIAAADLAELERDKAQDRYIERTEHEADRLKLLHWLVGFVRQAEVDLAVKLGRKMKPAARRRVVREYFDKRLAEVAGPMER